MRLLLVLVLTAAAWQPPAARAADSAEERLAGLFGYYLKEGGLWRQDNADREAGDGSPVAYVKRYAWGPGNVVVLDDTFALMEDGECEPWAHNVFHWDVAEQVVRGQIFHRAGAWFSGLVRRTGDHETTAELHGILPDGSQLTMRDTTDRSDPDRVVVTALFADGDTWTAGDQVSWVHLAAADRPCGI
jgi:hypothetical protein